MSAAEQRKPPAAAAAATTQPKRSLLDQAIKATKQTERPAPRT